MAKFNYYSDFQPNKTYQYKTYSLDGTKLLHQVNMKYLFAFSEGHQSKIEQFYLSKCFIEYNRRNNLSFPEDQKKDLNDKSCRYILCEKETIYYGMDGVEFHRKTAYYQYDKTFNMFKKGKKVTLKSPQQKTRTLYIATIKGNNNIEGSVFLPGGIHYGVKPGVIDRKERRITMLGLAQLEVECKMVDSLEII